MGPSPTSRITLVCLDCRTSARAGEFAESKCSKCGQPMIGIGKHWRIPKRKDDKAWKAFREKVEAAARKVQASIDRGTRSPYHKNLNL